MSGSQKCHHPDFQFNVVCHVFEEDTLKQFEISGKCTVCDGRVIFRGNMPIGVGWNEPHMTLEADAVTLPAFVEGDVVDESKARPGFRIDVSI